MRWLLFVVMCFSFVFVTIGQNKISIPVQKGIEKMSFVPEKLNKNSNLMFTPSPPVSSYFSDFETRKFDIYTRDFVFSSVQGIDGFMLQTPHPYPVATSVDDETILTAQLKFPIILQSDGIIKFDEIVLVDPGPSSKFKNKNPGGDYVCVEASSDLGINWIPLTTKYNSGVDDVWNHLFSSSIINNRSLAKGTPNIVKERTIKLVDGYNFFEGDTVLIRFSLTSNNVVNGWGWAIDNLAIQLEPSVENSSFKENYHFYPNPVKDLLFVERENNSGPEKVDIILTNQLGHIMYKEEMINSNTFGIKNIDTSDLAPGIYLITVTDHSFFTISRKFVKY